MIETLLLAGYFLNGGIGTFMQPSAGAGGSGPPVLNSITTQSGTPIATQGGSILIVG